MSEAEEHPLDGALLKELGYDEESEAAASLGIAAKTLKDYRRMGIGPPYTEVGRRILYSREGRINWLAAGGVRAREFAK